MKKVESTIVINAQSSIEDCSDSKSMPARYSGIAIRVFVGGLVLTKGGEGVTGSAKI